MSADVAPRDAKLLPIAWTLRATIALAAGALAVVVRPTAAAAERRLQQMRERVHVAELAVLDAEQVRIGRTAPAIRPAGAERAVDDDGADGFVHDEAAIHDVHTARHADLAAIGWRILARVHAAFDAHARKAPWDLVDLPLEKRVEVRVGGADERFARVTLLGRNRTPVLRRRVLQVVVGVEEPIACGRPDDLDLGNLVVIDAHARAKHVRLGLIGDDDLRERLASGFVEQAAVMIDLQRLTDQAFGNLDARHVLVVAEAVRER